MAAPAAIRLAITPREALMRNRPGRPLAQRARRLDRLAKARHGGPGALQEPLAGLGQADAARRALEQRDAEPRLQRLDRLAERRGRDAEFGRGGAEAAALRDQQEGGQAVEVTRSYCEVLLHGSCRL